MVKTQWKILFATFLVSCISFSLLIVAITTPHWVKYHQIQNLWSDKLISNNSIPQISGMAIPVDNSAGVGLATVNYGLLSGTVLRQVITSPTTYDLTSK